MTLKGFIARGERFDISDETARAVLPASPAPRTVSPSTSVDAASELEGRLRCKQTLRIDGTIKGEIECEKAVLVGECAHVYASITADEVQIAGVVEGDITARRKVTLERTAVVIGNLITPGIVIEEGAKLKGRIVIGSDDEPAVGAAVEAPKPSKKALAVAPKPVDAPVSQPVATSA